MGISWWESMCVFELVLNEVTHTLGPHAGLPQINAVIRKDGAHQLPFSSERRQKDRWTEKRNNPREKVDDNIVIVKSQKNKGFPWRHECLNVA